MLFLVGGEGENVTAAPALAAAVTGNTLAVGMDGRVEVCARTGWF